MTLTIEKAKEALNLAQAAALFPGRPHVDTVRRWCLKGVRCGTRLEFFRSGGVIYITPDAIERFLAEQNTTDPTLARRTKTAADELSDLGI